MTIALLLAAPAAAEAATVKVVDCVPAVERTERSATFEARLRAARGSERLALRFTLQVRARGLRAWRRVPAPGFDTWLTSVAGVRRYSYAKTVLGLTAPAAYRAVVRFRWLDADGAVLKRARVVSATCRQPDMRPDLAPLRIDVLPGHDRGTRSYAVVLRNEGRTDALAFAAALRVGGYELRPAALPGLAAGVERVFTFAGPRCTPGEPLVATVDPAGAVDERDEDDNVLVASCPA